MIHYIAMICGFILDFFLIDKPEWPHLVRFMGKSISFFEKNLRKISKNNMTLLFSGCIIVLANILIWGFFAYISSVFTYAINDILGFVLESFLFFQIFAKASLRYESMKVYKSCLNNDLEGARKNLSMIVGRDTMNLDFEHIIKADIETVAENMSDGIVAPWFYGTLGSILSFFVFNRNFFWLILVLPLVYKTVNTMDSMIGYKDEKYFYIGKAAARLDDIVNFIPSRFCALILLITIFFYSIFKRKLDIFAESLRSFIKYRYVHSSPNAGQTESIVAGFFNTKLLGDASYFGKIVKKKSIGDGENKVKVLDILILNNMLYGSYLILLFINLIIGGIACYTL